MNFLSVEYEIYFFLRQNGCFICVAIEKNAESICRVVSSARHVAKRSGSHLRSAAMTATDR
jgi:hypothetical protein